MGQMKSFYRSGGDGAYIELEDGRFADTVTNSTNVESMSATEAMEALIALDTEEVAEPWHSMMNVTEIEEYVGALTSPFTTEQAAALSGVDRKGILQAINRGQLEATKFGRDWQIDRAELQRWMDEKRPVGRPKSLYRQVEERIDNTPDLQPYRDAILYDWPEGDEHLRWALDADVDELLAWAETAETD